MAGSSGGDDPNGSRGGSVDAKTSSAMELVPHFPHVGRVARYCDLPVSFCSGRDGTGWCPKEDERNAMCLQEIFDTRFAGEATEASGIESVGSSSPRSGVRAHRQSPYPLAGVESSSER